MRLVDRKQAQMSALRQGRQQCQKAWCGDALRRGVQQREFTPQQLLLHIRRLLGRQGGIEKGGADTRLVQRAHLVVHQRDQG